MILALRTDTKVAELYLVDATSGQESGRDVWQADRNLARDLLAHIDALITAHGTWQQLSGVVVFRGPGSFTGLRIGITTANTIAYAETLPIVGETGDQWLAQGLKRLQAGESDKMILPEYGADPHITAPKK